MGIQVPHSWQHQPEQPNQSEQPKPGAPREAEPLPDTPRVAALGHAPTAAAFEVGSDNPVPHETAEQLTETQTERIALLGHTLSILASSGAPIAGHPRSRFDNAYCASPPSLHRPVILVRPAASQAAAAPEMPRILALRVTGGEMQAINGHDQAFNSGLELRDGERGVHHWNESGVMATLLDNAENQTEMDLLVATAFAPQGSRSKPTRSLQLGRYVFRGLTRQQSRDMLCTTIGALHAQDPENGQVNAVIRGMNDLVQRLVRPHVAGEKQPDEHDRRLGQSLWTALLDHGIVETQVFANNPSLAIPEIAVELAARSANENLFPRLPNERRLSAASDYLHRVLDHLAKQSGRNAENIGTIRGALYKTQPRQSLPMQNILEFANRITVRVNGFYEGAPDRQRELLTISGQPSDLTQCGEAVFRILDITGNDADATAANRAYAEIFDAIMQPLYERFAAARTVTIADICARYPDTKEDLVLAEDLRGTASREGWSAATAQYHATLGSAGSRGTKYRFTQRHTVRKPGGGLLS